MLSINILAQADHLMVPSFYGKLSLLEETQPLNNPDGKMKKIIPLILLGLSLASLNAAKKPNILIIMSDDQGYGDISCYGGSPDVQTPNMDKLAASGIRFTDGYVTAPICNASRTAILTGRYQQRFGCQWFSSGRLPDEKVPTLAETLRKAGYRTHKLGKTHFPGGNEDRVASRQHPLSHGFDTFFGIIGNHDLKRFTQDDIEKFGKRHWQNVGPMWENNQKVDMKGYSTEILTDRAIKIIEENSKDKPFYLHLSYLAVHTPTWQAPQKYLDKYGLEGLDDSLKHSAFKSKVIYKGNQLRNPEEWRKRYLAALDCLDNNIGRVLSALKKSGELENTLIVFLSDNGGTRITASNNAPLRGSKYYLNEGGVRVPYIVSYPKLFPQGKVSPALVSSLDIYPTVLDVTGVPDQNLKLDGLSLVGKIEGKPTDKVHDAIFWQTKNGWAVRQGDYKLRMIKKTHKVAPWPVVEEKGLALYNLQKDIGESSDLAEQMPEKVKTLSELYQAWSKSISPAQSKK